MHNKLQGKHILVGISGGIAAYKSIELIRLLRKAEADVRVCLTENASQFVSPLTLQAVSANPVSQPLFDHQAELAMGHIELAKWADLIIIAPTTANIIAHLAHGIADDLLTTLCLATNAPIYFAPAMNQQMFAQPIVQKNIQKLLTLGYHQIGPNAGEQACGDVGAGRMSEPSELFEQILMHFTRSQKFKGLSVAITAGPTREDIDPVRYISNHSSGKMGFALAKAFADHGAKVTLIAGPVQLATPVGCQRIDVISAVDMHRASLALAPSQDIFIGCAAVADYRMANIAEQKMKKSGQDDKHLVLELIQNPDIIAEVAALTKNRPFVVGFAAETQDVDNYAKTKLKNKNLDLICANDVSSSTQGFNSDKNALTLFWESGHLALEVQNKSALAEKLSHIIVEKAKLIK